MCADKAYVDHFYFEQYEGNYSVIIPFYIEYKTSIADGVNTVECLSYVGKRISLCLFCLLKPLL